MTNNNQREYLNVKHEERPLETLAKSGEFMNKVLDKAGKKDELRDEPAVTKSQNVFYTFENGE